MLGYITESSSFQMHTHASKRHLTATLQHARCNLHGVQQRRLLVDMVVRAYDTHQRPPFNPNEASALEVCADGGHINIALLNALYKQLHRLEAQQ